MAGHTRGRPPELQLLQHAVDQHHRRGGQSNSHRVGAGRVQQGRQQRGGRNAGGRGSHGLEGGGKQATSQQPSTKRRNRTERALYKQECPHTRGGARLTNVPPRGARR